MITKSKLRILCLLLVSIFIISFLLQTNHFTLHSVYAQSDDLEQQLKDKQDEIKKLQDQLAQAQTQEKTLKSELDKIDGQIKLTELKIQAAQFQVTKLDKEITDLSGRIDRLSTTVDKMSEVLLSRIVTTYKYNSYDTLDLLFSAKGFSDLLERVKYIQIIQANDKKVLYQLQATKQTYNDQKSDKQTREAQQKVLQKNLEDLQTQLDGQKKQKQDLLAETQGNETTYEHLIAQAQAQLASLSGFARARSGGVISLVPHADKSDDWGKYYNQRDENWGKNFIGLSADQIWEVGCLITSFAMVSSHYGASITPADVAGNSDNFALGTAFFKIPGPSANGHSSDYVTNPSLDSLKSEVKAGHPVIAGLSANGGPYPNHYSDHWVVLRAVNGDGSFNINDPWSEGAMNVSLNDHYSGWAIIEARIYP